MDEAYTPVVKAKPERGRELKSATMPTEKLIEGYVDGQKYLVPDRNLEAMKDMINIKMRPRRSLRYKHQTSFEISDYDHLQEKLKRILEKMSSFSDATSQSSQESASAKSAEIGDDYGGTQTDSIEDERSKQSITESNGSKASKESLIDSDSKHFADNANEIKALEESLILSKYDRSVANDYDSKASKEYLNENKSKQSASDSSESEATRESSIGTFDSSISYDSEEGIVGQQNLTNLKPEEEGDEKREAEQEFYKESKYSLTKTEKQGSASDFSKSKAPKESSIATFHSPLSYDKGEEIVERQNFTNVEPEQEDDEKKETKKEFYKKGSIKTGELLRLTDEENKPVKMKDPMMSTNNIAQPLKKYLELPSQIEFPIIKPQVREAFEPEKCHFRFLLSGHLRDDTPIFIIQEYDSKSTIFKNTTADFFDSKQDEHFDIAISGKFYKQNILEELNGEPISYDVLPQKIIIEKTKSRVYINSFSFDYNCVNTELNIKGKFVKHNILDLLTPILSFKLEPKIPEFSILKENYIPLRNDPITTVLIYTPKYVNPFNFFNVSDSIKSNNKGSSTCNTTVSAVKSKNATSPPYVNNKNIYSNDYANDQCKDHVENAIKHNETKKRDAMHQKIVNNPNKNESNYKNSSKENCSTFHKDFDNYADKQMQKLKNMFMKKPSPKKESDRFVHQISLPSCELQDCIPDLKTYYQADDAGEYYSTFNECAPE